MDTASTATIPPAWLDRDHGRADAVTRAWRITSNDNANHQHRLEAEHRAALANYNGATSTLFRVHDEHYPRQRQFRWRVNPGIVRALVAHGGHQHSMVSGAEPSVPGTSIMSPLKGRGKANATQAMAFQPHITGAAAEGRCLRALAFIMKRRDPWGRRVVLPLLRPRDRLSLMILR
jgi:hypothetical protein